MTAEVGALNTLAVALAADSAVTIGKESNKIYTSANKIFQLSCSAPVGVMIYGNADLVGLPWETIIKVYRQQLGDTRFDTLGEYAEAFIDFLAAGGQGMLSQKQQERHAGMVVYSFFEEVKDSLWRRVQAEIQEGKDLQEEDVDKLLHERVKWFLKRVRAEELLPGFSKADIATAASTYKDGIDEAAVEVFRPTIPRKTKLALRKLGAELLCRKVPTALTTGVVIAGFGEKEYTPALAVCEIDEMALGRLRHVMDRELHRIDDDTRALVMPVAQKEMVHSFMEGIEPGLLGFMHGSTADLFTGVVKEIFELVAKVDPKLGEGLEKAVGPMVLKRVHQLFAGWKERREEIWKPVLRITGSLPKDELAAMAEALVNLTKFRRRVTTERETVGGPIDVAVITKGDGFVWIKRKHYFSPEYNPRAMARYEQGG